MPLLSTSTSDISEPDWEALRASLSRFPYEISVHGHGQAPHTITKKKTVEEKIKELWMRSTYYKSLPVKHSIPKTKAKEKPYYRVDRW